ncbi:MAG TPA: hypothetical protein VFI31_23560 [Pirellulales bacterium]|nr:hypothetical protein [Pirellulales bacterium]
MNLGSLYLLLALCGQVQPRVPDLRDATPRDAAPATDVDSDIESADENPTIESDPPVTAPQKAAKSDPPAAAPQKATESAPPADANATADVLAPTRNLTTKADTPDSLLQWLAQADTSLDGKRISLADLLSRIYDRPQQAVVIPAYWKLSAAEFEYRIAADEALRLQQLLPPADPSGKHASDSLLEARLAAAEARLREAELAVINQQHALADQMRLPASEPLPLAGDLPHAGAYRTYFQEKYVRVAPPRAHLIDRTLPLLQRAIELRASAAVSAADCAEAGVEAYHAGQLDLAATVDGIGELTRQRRAFVAAVRDYNLDIADYALSVVPAGLTSAQLVSILIGPPPTAQRAQPADPKQASLGRGGINQAGFNAPLFAPAGQPTLAPTRPAANLPAADGGETSSPPSANPPRRAPRRKGASTNQSGDAPRRIKSVPPSATSSHSLAGQRHLAAKPPAEEPSAAPTENAADQGLYTALRDLSPVKRAQELSATLHWTQAGSESLGGESRGMATTLIDAFTASVGLDRRSVIQAYWRACERLAACQVSKSEIELLRALESAALGMRAQPGGAEAMLHLRTSQLAAQAAAEECTVGLLNAQFALAQLMRRPLEGPWPVPTTPPHAGGYRLKVDAQPANVLQNSLVQRLTVALPLEHDVLQKHADAVVTADAAHVEAVLGFEAGQRPLDEAVTSVRYLSDETLAFLDIQTAYNLSFADYVLSVAPPGVSDSTLAGVLVVVSR